MQRAIKLCSETIHHPLLPLPSSTEFVAVKFSAKILNSYSTVVHVRHFCLAHGNELGLISYLAAWPLS